MRRHLDRKRKERGVKRDSKPVRGDSAATLIEDGDDAEEDDGIQVRHAAYREYHRCYSSATRDLWIISFIEQIVPEEEMARSRAFSMLPNLIGRTKIGLTAPSTELLPPRSWPKGSPYTVGVTRTPENGRLMSTKALLGRKSEVPTWVKTWADFRDGC